MSNPQEANYTFQEDERVMAWFYSAWYYATVRRLFTKENVLHAEVLWESEYSTSELPVTYLSRIQTSAASVAEVSAAEEPASNVETEASRQILAEDHAGGLPEPQVAVVEPSKPFAPPPGLEGMNLPDARDAVNAPPATPATPATPAIPATPATPPSPAPLSANAEEPGVEASIQVVEPEEPKPTILTSSPQPRLGQKEKGGGLHVANVPVCHRQPPTAPPSVPPSVMVNAARRKRGGDGPSDSDLRSWAANWKLQENTIKYLKGLPGKVQKSVISGFSAPASTHCFDAMLHNYARSILERVWDGEVDVDGFVENWSLDVNTAEFLEKLPLELKKQVIWGFHPKEGKPLDVQVRRFATSIADSMKIPVPRERSSSGTASNATTKATETGGATPAEREAPAALPPKPFNLQEEQLAFAQRYHVKGVALQTLKGLPFELQKQVLTEFESKVGPRDVDKALLNYINNLGKSQPKPPKTPKAKEDSAQETKAKPPAKTPEVAPAIAAARAQPASPSPPPEVSKEPAFKKAQEKSSGGTPLTLPMRVAPKPPPKSGFALLHESTSEEEPESTEKNLKQRKKDAASKGAKDARSSQAEEKKSAKKKSDEVRPAPSKETSASVPPQGGDAERTGPGPKSKKKTAEKLLPESVPSVPFLQSPAQIEMPCMEELMAPQTRKTSQSEHPLSACQPDVNDIPNPDMPWEFENLCLRDDPIELVPKTKLFSPSRPTEAGEGHPGLEACDLASPEIKVDQNEVNPTERSGQNMSSQTEEASTSCRSEVNDSSEGEDMDIEDKEEKRQKLRERGTQRVGRTRRNQKTRVTNARRCTEASSKPCKDPRCENCSKKSSES